MTRTEQKYAFMTGAASGIGRATAERFAREGWWIGAADRDAEGLERLRADLGPDRCHTWLLDVTDAARYETVASELAKATGGRLHLLFNNAGIATAGFFDEVPLEAHRKLVDVNILGVVHGILAILPLLKATPGSLCFTTSSSAATYGVPGMATYSATKFAVKGLTEALAVELSRYDVRVADVLPGVIDTAIFATTPVYSGGKALPAEVRPSTPPAARKGPFRLISAEEVADAVWRAAEGDGRLHWYVPEDVEDIERAKVESVEAIRDERIAEHRKRFGG